jgi:hypothetical protein
MAKKAGMYRPTRQLAGFAQKIKSLVKLIF